MYYENFPKENDDGCIEYKLKLINISNDKVIKYATQMKWRLQEGNGLAIYLLGLLDCGREIGILEEDIDETLHQLKLIIDNIKCQLYKYYFYTLDNKRKIIIAFIKEEINNKIFI